MPALRSLLVLAGLLLIAPAVQAAPDTLRLCHAADESFPWLLKRTPGVSQTMAIEAAAALKLKLELRPMATAACLEAIQQGRMDGAISIAFVNERVVFLAYPGMKGGQPDVTLRMYNNSFSLFRRKQDKLVWDGRKLEVPGAVGVRRGSSITARLQDLGAKVDASSTGYLDVLKRLARGEVAAAAVETIEGAETVRHDFNMRSTLEEVPQPLLLEPFYTVFAQDFLRRSPDLAKAFWEKERTLRQSPDFARKVAHLVRKLD